MRKKLMIMALVMAVTITSLVGCGEQKVETTADDEGTVIEQNENSEGEDTEGENAETEIKEFANYADCKVAVGFNFIVLPKEYNYKMNKISVFNNVVSIEMSSIDDENVLVLLSTAEGDQKLATGIPEKTEENDILGINVTFGYGADGTGYHMAEWTNKDMSYSIDSLGITDEKFETMVADIVSTTI